MRKSKAVIAVQSLAAYDSLVRCNAGRRSHPRPGADRFEGSFTRGLGLHCTLESLMRSMESEPREQGIRLVDGCPRSSTDS